MSEPYEERLWRCDECGEYLPKEVVIIDREFIYCQPCWNKFVEGGEKDEMSKL